jgi:hypothetical protein
MGGRRGKVLKTGKAPATIDEALTIVKRIRVRGTASVRASDIFTLLRHHGIGCSVDSFSSVGWTAKLGDPARGFVAEQGRFRTVDDAANWLLEEAKRHFPDAMPGGA